MILFVDMKSLTFLILSSDEDLVIKVENSSYIQYDVLANAVVTLHCHYHPLDLHHTTVKELRRS